MPRRRRSAQKQSKKYPYPRLLLAGVLMSSAAVTMFGISFYKQMKAEEERKRYETQLERENLSKMRKENEIFDQQRREAALDKQRRDASEKRKRDAFDKQIREDAILRKQRADELDKKFSKNLRDVKLAVIRNALFDFSSRRTNMEGLEKALVAKNIKIFHSENDLKIVFEINEKIGRGAFSNVFRVRKKSNNVFYALKRFIIKSKGDMDFVGLELSDAAKEFYIVHETLKCMDGVICSRDFAVGLNPIQVLILMDLATNTLETKMSKVSSDVEQLMTWAVRLFDVLQKIHEQGVVHGDIHLNNILFKEDGLPYFSDFGKSRLLSEMNNILTRNNAQWLDFHRLAGLFYYKLEELLPKDEFSNPMNDMKFFFESLHHSHDIGDVPPPTNFAERIRTRTFYTPPLYNEHDEIHEDETERQAARRMRRMGKRQYQYENKEFRNKAVFGV